MLKFPPHKRWTRAEQWLFATPMLVGIFGFGMAVGPDFVRKQRGLPRELKISTKGPLISMALSQEGNLLAVGEQLSGRVLTRTNSIYLWDAKALKPLPPLTRPIIRLKRNTDSYTRILVVSPNGRFVGYGKGSRDFEMFDRQTQKVLWQQQGTGDSAQFSPNGKWLALTDNKYRILDIQNGQVVKQWTPRSPSDHSVVAFSPDGKMVGSVVGQPQYVDGSDYDKNIERSLKDPTCKIEIRSTTDWKIERTFQISNVQHLAFSPDGRLLVAVAGLCDALGGCRGSVTRCFDIGSSQLLWEMDSRDANADPALQFIEDICFSPGGELAVVGGTKILLLDAQTGQKQRTLVVPKFPRAYYPSAAFMRFSPDGKRLLARGRDSILVWDLD